MKLKKFRIFIVISTISIFILTKAYTQQKASLNSSNVKANLNGIEIPANYKDWKVLSTSHRIDNKSMRIIIGNDIAINASRAGEIYPWPDGSIIGKLVFKQKMEDNWPTAIAPDSEKFIHAEFMYKDSIRFASNGTSWGWARWLREDQTPYGDENDINQSCISCHSPVKGNDWVYSTPIKLP